MGRFQPMRSSPPRYGLPVREAERAGKRTNNDESEEPAIRGLLVEPFAYSANISSF